MSTESAAYLSPPRLSGQAKASPWEKDKILEMSPERAD